MADVSALVDELRRIGEAAEMPELLRLADGLLKGLEKAAGVQGDASTCIEIERKYLLRTLPPRTEGVDGQRLAQGYLPGERLVERVRKVGEGAGAHYLRTVKLGEGVSRIEIEEACDAEVFEALWALTEGRRIEKTRYRVPQGTLTWEVDEFSGFDLVLAEIELPHPDTAVEFPDWLEPYVVREVTTERAFTNWALSR